MYYLSKIISTKDVNYLYDAMYNKLYIISDSVKSYLEFDDKSYEQEYIAFLKENKSVENNCRDVTQKQNFNISYYLTDEEIKYQYQNKMMILTLVLTERCNFKCEYCAYMQKYESNYKLKDMTEETAYKAIDLFAKSNVDNPNISFGFYGGEPLLKFKLIKKCIEYYKNHYWYNIPNFSFVTNGLLINDEIADYLIKNEISIYVSFDGPQQIHDRYRIDLCRNGTHSRVYENLYLLYNKSKSYFKKHVGFNVVITSQEDNREIYDYIDKFWINNISLIDVNVTPYFQKLLDNKKIINIKPSNINYTEYHFLYSNMLRTFKKYRMTLSKTFDNNIIFPGNFCIPGVRKNLVTADGKIVVCERVDETNPIFEIGNVWEGIDQKKINMLIEKATTNLKLRCKDCWAIRFCTQCFSNVFNNNETFCLKEKKKIEKDLKYYLDYIIKDENILNQLDNMVLV